MNWLTERPRSIVEMWNILCEAVWERLDFFGISRENLSFDRISGVPCRKNILNQYIPGMTGAVRELIFASFDPRKIGQWCDLSEWPWTGSNDFQHPHGAFWEIAGADGYAFYRTAPYLPFPRHTMSQWMMAAAKVLNDVVRYPRPSFNLRGDILLDGELEAEDFYNHRTYHASLAEAISIPISNRNGSLSVDGLSLAQWRSSVGRGRLLNMRWRYMGPVTVSGYNRSYLTPQLRGVFRVRSHVSMTHYENWTEKNTYNAGVQTFDVDAVSGTASGYIDVSAASTAVDSTYNSGSQSGYSQADVEIGHSGQEILLAGENFQPLPYTYVE